MATRVTGKLVNHITPSRFRKPSPAPMREQLEEMESYKRDLILDGYTAQELKDMLNEELSMLEKNQPKIDALREVIKGR